MSTLSNTIERKFQDSVPLDDWEIETEQGWKDLTSIHQTISYTVYRIELENGLFLEGADNHIVILSTGEECFIKDLIPNNSYVKTIIGDSLCIKVENLYYEEEMYDPEVNSESHLYYSNGILSHNTLTVGTYLLYEAIFTRDLFIALVANNAAKSVEILSRIKSIYEEIPNWLKPGILVWNRGSVEFENGSKIVALPAKSSALRSYAVNILYCLSGETLVKIQNESGEISEKTLNDLAGIVENEDVFLDNKYQKIYWNLMTSAKKRYTTSDVFYEKHHIFPKSIYGENGYIVKLTLREHYLAHKLLVKMTTGKNKAKMVCACFLMMDKNKDFLKINSKEYERMRTNFSDSRKEWWKDNRKEILDNREKTEFRKKISKAQKRIWEENKEEKMKKRYENGHYEKTSKSLTGIKRANPQNKDIEKIRKMAETHRGMKRSEKAKENISQGKKKYFQQNGTKSQGKGMVYIHNKNTAEIKRVEKDFVYDSDWEKGYGKRKIK